MKSSRSLAPWLAFIAAAAPLTHAETLYWDTNGSTAGSGNSGGVWDTGTTTNWNATADGTGSTQDWADGDSAVFSAGGDGTATKTVTLDGIIKTPSILLEEVGLVNLSGGTIDITGGSNFDTSELGGNTNRSLTWSSDITGTGGLTIAGHGSTSDTGGSSNTIFYLTGSNDFTGDITITSGVIHAGSNFGNASNKVILNGGGLVDNNQNLNFSRDIQVDSGFTGVYRTYGSVSTGQISGAILGGGTLRHTDGGTLTLSGDGSAFTGTYNNARGHTYLTTTDWSGTHFVNSDGSSLRFNATGETSIKSYEGDRDVFINGSRLNVVDGTITVAAGAANNNFWIQGGGALTSESGNLTLNWNVPYATAGDQSLRVVVEDYDGSTPLTLVKNGPGGLNNFDKANTYSGGTVINGGRITASNVSSFGTGTVTINGDETVGGQAFLAVSGGTYANDFGISGIGSSESAGNLGAIRFNNNTISGDVTVDNNARIVAYSGATGTHTGALLGSADLEINIAGNSNANGTITLSGDGSAFAGDITISGGTLQIGSGGTSGSLGSGNIVNNASLDFNRSDDLTYAGVISGTGTLTKLGTGTLTLTSANSYSGTTTVAAGTLEVQAKSGDVKYVVDQGATLKLGYSTGGGYANTNLKLHGDGVGATTGLHLEGGSSYNASGTIQLLTAPTTVRQYGTGLAAIGMFDINGTGISVDAAASGSVIASDIQFVSRGYGMSVNVASGSNTATGDLVVNGPLNVGNLGFYKRGAGSVALNGAATSGNTAVRIQGGTVITGVAGALGINADLPISSGAKLQLNGFDQAARNLSGAGSVVNGSATAATLTMGQTSDTTFSGILGGAGTDENNFGFTKSGGATLTLTGANTYTGDTQISTGTLLVNNSSGSGTGSGLVNVSTTGTLGGSGTIAGATTVSGTLAPGNSPGTLSFGSDLGLNDTAILEIELDPTLMTPGGGFNDLLAIAGNLTLDGLLNVTATSGDFLTATAGDTWTLATYGGTLTDNGLSFGSMPALDSGYSWALDTSTSGTVNLTVVPEPRVLLSGALGILLLLRRRR